MSRDRDDWDEATTDKVHALSPVRDPDADSLDIAAPEPPGAPAPGSAFARRPTTEDPREGDTTDPFQPPAVTPRELPRWPRTPSPWRVRAQWGVAGLVAGIALSVGLMVAITQPADRVSSGETTDYSGETHRDIDPAERDSTANDRQVTTTRESRKRGSPTAKSERNGDTAERSEDVAAFTIGKHGSSDVAIAIVHKRRWVGRDLAIHVTVLNRGTADLALTGFSLVGERGSRIRVDRGDFEPMRLGPTRAGAGELRVVDAASMSNLTWKLVVESESGPVAEVAELRWR